MAFHVPNQYRIRPSHHPQLGSTEVDGNNGAFTFLYNEHRPPLQVRCIASDGGGWEHVSVSLSKQLTPSWKLMCYVKDLFWDVEDAVMQLHPPLSQYINNHEHCLHLWRPTARENMIPLPPMEMVGLVNVTQEQAKTLIQQSRTVSPRQRRKRKKKR